MTSRQPLKRSRGRAASLAAVALLACASPAGAAEAPDFTLHERLGKDWRNECVTFPLNEAQRKSAARGRALADADGQAMAYQVVEDAAGAARLCLQTDLPAYTTRSWRFTTGKAVQDSGLRVARARGERTITIANELIAIRIREELPDGKGPIAGIRLRSGAWTGDSTFTPSAGARIVSYEVVTLANGPAFAEVECRASFADEGAWRLRVRVEDGEPVVLVDEFHDAPTGGTFSLALGGEGFQPTHMLNRESRVETAQVQAEPIGDYLLEPWLRWNNHRHGNWIALFTPTPAAGDGGLGIDELIDDLKDAEAPKPKDPHPDMLAIALLKPASWVDPAWAGRAKQAGPNLRATVRDGVTTLDKPVQGGRRAWLLGALNKAASEEILGRENRRVAPPPQKLVLKHGDFPLDKVKDFVLDWEGDDDNHPLLYVRKKDLPALKSRLVSDPKELVRWTSQQPIDKYFLDGPIKEFLATGDPRLGRRIAEKAEEYLQACVDWYLEQDRFHCPGTAPHMQSLIITTVNLIDPVLSAPAFTPEARKRVLAKLAFIGYVISADDYWSPERGYSGFANMTSVVALYRTAIGCLLPSHPEAKRWAGQGLNQLRWQLTAWSDEDGGWLEAPHYAMVSFDHMLAGFTMAANAGLAEDLYSPRMRKVVEWFSTISTPRDSRTGGSRHHPPIGNTYHGEPHGLNGLAAALWKDRDPEFAAQMQWLFEQHGSFPGLGIGWNFPSMLGYRFLMTSSGVQPQPATYGSAWFRKTGVALRNTMQSERETYLHMIAGSNHDHYDADSGSIILYGKGRVLADDWGYIGRHPPQWHSMLTSSGANGYGIMNVTEFAAGKTLDYVKGTKGTWQREIAFVKDADPLGPNYFLLRDTHSADDTATWRLWLMPEPAPEAKKPARPDLPGDPGLADTAAGGSLLDELVAEEEEEKRKKASAAAPAPPGVVIHENGATLVGGEDVDLDIFIYQPARLGLKTETATQRVSAAYRGGSQVSVEIVQTALIGTLQGNGTITALLYPRLKTEKTPTVTWSEDGNMVQIETAAGRDCVMLAPKPERKQVATGLAALPKGPPIYGGSSHTRNGDETPWFVVNDTGADIVTEDANVKSPIRFAAGAVAVHPRSVEIPATVAWQSPMSGSISLEARVQHLNPGVNKNHPHKSDGAIGEIRKGDKILGTVAIPHGGPEVTLTANAIHVKPGDLVRLVIGVNEYSWFDFARVDMVVRADDGRTWNLAESLRKGEKLANDLPAGARDAVWWACGGDGDKLDLSLTEPLPLPRLNAFGGKVRLEGTVGAVQVRGADAVLSLAAAGEISTDKGQLVSDGPATKMIKWK